MKVSVSLPDDDIAFLDAYVRTHQVASRSAALRVAVDLLRASELGGDYAAAWEEWAADGGAEDWDVVAGDGVGS